VIHIIGRSEVSTDQENEEERKGSKQASRGSKCIQALIGGHRSIRGGSLFVAPSLIKGQHRAGNIKSSKNHRGTPGVGPIVYPPNAINSAALPGNETRKNEK
jgi:hypothetical protein